MVTENLSDIDARAVNSIPLFNDDAGRNVVVRVGRYGPYLQRALPDATEEPAEDRVSIPEGVAPDELTPEKVNELFLGGGGERSLGDDPATGEAVMLKSGRFGPYVQAGERKSSLLKTQTPDTVTLEEALQLLSCPARGGQGPGRRGDRRGQRPLRPVRQARRRLPLAGERGQALHGHAGGGAGAAGRPEDPPAPRRRAAAARDGRRPGHREADGDQGGPVRPVRDRRRVQRVAAPRPDAGGADGRAGVRDARREARQGPGARRRRPPPRRPRPRSAADGAAPAKKTAAKKATAKKATAKKTPAKKAAPGKATNAAPPQEGSPEEGRPRQGDGLRRVVIRKVVTPQG